MIKIDLITGINSEPGIPKKYCLNQNYPNPFNPVTTIDFSIPANEFVSIEVFNALGERISELVNSKLAAGNYSVDFNGENLPSGIYFYRISTGEFAQTNKMILVK